MNLCVYHEAAGLFAIHETFGDSICSQDLITIRQERDREIPKKGYRNITNSWKIKLLSLLRSHLPLAELLEDDSVGKTLSADSDPLQHTVAPQLLQDQVSIQFSCLKRTVFQFYYIGFFEENTHITKY